MTMSDDPHLPAYDGACIANVVPVLLGSFDGDESWVPRTVLDAERVVLPAVLAIPPLIDRVRGHTLTAFRRRVPARITLADLDGTVAEVD